MEVCNFEIAVKLKEKGFRYNTSYWYNQFGALLNKDQNDRKSKNSVLTNDKSYGVDAPTISQVLKWLREEKNIEVVASFSYRDRVWGYQVGDMTLSEDSILAYDYSFSTYEQATIEGIKYVVDNLI